MESVAAAQSSIADPNKDSAKENAVADDNEDSENRESYENYNYTSIFEDETTSSSETDEDEVEIKLKKELILGEYEDKGDAKTQDDKDNDSDKNIGTSSFYTKGKDQEAAVKALQNCTDDTKVVSDEDIIGRCYLK